MSEVDKLGFFPSQDPFTNMETVRTGVASELTNYIV